MALAMSIVRRFSSRIEPDPMNALWHFATGFIPDFLDRRAGPVGWVRWPHRGVQFLDERFVIPRKQRPYVFSPKFELRFNVAFEEVVRACADPTRPGIARRAGESWITPELVEALLGLRRLGFAHSFETWEAGKLVGGIWGVQVGSLVTMSSMFSRASNASKCAMARTMMRLRERGFALVDMGMVPDHLVHFGAEWLPRWKFEAMLPALIRDRRSIDDEHPCPPLPAFIRAGEPLVRLARKLRGRVHRPKEAMEPQMNADERGCSV